MLSVLHYRPMICQHEVVVELKGSYLFLFSYSLFCEFQESVGRNTEILQVEAVVLLLPFEMK